MRRTQLAVGMLLGILLATANVSRAQLPLQFLFDGFSMMVENKRFDNFVLNENTFPNVDPLNITVSPVIVFPLMTVGLKFDPFTAWTDPTPLDGGYVLDFSYDVTVVHLPFLYEDIRRVEMKGEPSGDPSNPEARVRKQVFDRNGVLIGSLDIHEGVPSDHTQAFILPQQVVHIRDRVEVNNLGTGAAPRLTEFVQTVTVVPEPGVHVLATAILTLGVALLLLRRRA